MNITFYTFSKRRNSTKIPTGAGTVKDCKLKDNCSVHDPVILLANSPTLYDYAYIGTWGRYYFVHDIVSVANGLTEYHLTEDVLASNKTAIGSTVAHIAYASDHYNEFIVDPRMQVSTATAPQSVLVNAIGTAPASIFNQDHFLLTVFNDAGYTASGVCSTYYMTDSELVSLINWMCDDTIMHTLGTFFNGNPLSAISSCKWIPYTINPAHLSALHTTVKIGTLDSQVEAKEVMIYNRETYGYKMQWDFHQDFRRVSPYTKGLLYLPGIGNVEVNLADFIGSDYMYIKVNIEDITGDVTYYVHNKLGNIIATYACNVASDIPIGWTTSNASGVGNSIIGTIGGAGVALVGALSGNAIAAVGGVSTAIASASNVALASNQKTTTVTGGLGSRSVSAEPAIKFTVFVASTMNPESADYIATLGRPVGEVHAINTHSGFVQTIDAHVSLAGSEQEMQEVNDFLNSGIYYE